MKVKPEIKTKANERDCKRQKQNANENKRNEPTNFALFRILEKFVSRFIFNGIFVGISISKKLCWNCSLKC